MIYTSLVFLFQEGEIEFGTKLSILRS